MPDEALRQYAQGVLTVCKYQGEQSLAVIEIESISAVVGMVPFHEQVESHDPRFYLAERLGLDVYDSGTIIGEDDDDGVE
jgi:hypothetical protein